MRRLLIKKKKKKTLREANSYVNALSKLGNYSSCNSVIFYDPLPVVEKFLFLAKEGVYCNRLVIL